MFKKLMVLALVLALAVCTFVACGGSADTDAPDTSALDTNSPETDAVKCNGDDIHDVEVEERAATCQDRGYRIETCKVCGEVVVETAYPKTACTPAAPATCTSASVCSVCGDVVEAAKGHEASDTVVQDLGCSAVYSCRGEGCTETITVVKKDAQHSVDLPATFGADTVVKDGCVCAPCSTCGQNVPVTGDVRLSLNFDGTDVASEIDAIATAENGLSYTVVHGSDQGGDSVLPPRIEAHGDATDGHTSVLLVPHNRSASINFNGALLADAEYFVVSFDWRITKVGHTSNKIIMFGQANKKIDGVTVDTNYAVAFRVDRSDGTLYDGASKEGTFAMTAVPGEWHEAVVVVNNQNGEISVYIDGQFYASGAGEKWKVAAGGEYSWRLGGVYNVYHRPEFDKFKVSVIR